MYTSGECINISSFFSQVSYAGSDGDCIVFHVLLMYAYTACTVVFVAKQQEQSTPTTIIHCLHMSRCNDLAAVLY